MKFQESALAHKLLDGLKGVEIGASAHNSFGLKNCLNVDITDSLDTVFKRDEIKLCGEAAKVDVVAPGDRLPFPDSSQDYVISSHVFEHFPDPIRALKEWWRVTRSGGYIFMIVPHKDRTFDKDRPRTPLWELIERHDGRRPLPVDLSQHCSVWITEDVLELVEWLGWGVVAFEDVDTKVGNGFTVVVQVLK